MRADLHAELEQAHADERAQLQARIDELTRQINDPEGAFEAERQRLADLERRLLREGNELGAERLQTALAALQRGESAQAEALFEEITTREALAVERKARAQFGLGEIAEGRVNWADAARHYAEAARLNPTLVTHAKAGEFLYRAGNYRLAERHLQDALDLARQADPGGLTEATAMNNLATLLDSTGQYGEAEALYRQALEILRAALGPDHPDTATSLNNLASLLRATGRFDEAEPLYRQALEIRRASLGPDHPSTATSLNNLAGLLRATGRHDEAEPLYRQALEITRAALGPDHPDTAIRLNNFAGLLYATGRYDEAVPLFVEAVRGMRAALGEGHPNTRLFAQNAAYVLREHAPDHPDLPWIADLAGE